LGFGEFIAYAMPFLLHLFLTERPLIKWITFAVIPVQIFVLVKVDARSGVIGVMIALLAYVAVWALFRWRNIKHSLMAPAVALSFPAAAAVLLAATFAVHRLRAVVWGIGITQASTDARKEMYRLGLPKVLDNPFGYGLGRGGVVLGYFSPGGQLTIDTYYLALLLEIGVAGFLVYFCLFIYAIFRGVIFTARQERLEDSYVFPAVIVLVNFVIIKSVFAQMDNHPLVFLILGGVVAYVAQRSSGSGRIGHSQKMTVAASATAEKNAVGLRS
jgi:O-antigen ligase